jgi:hypothetical protein
MNKQVHFNDTEKSYNIDFSDDIEKSNNIEKSNDIDESSDSDDDIYKNNDNPIILSIMNKFLEKYEHLNNKKSKKIIYYLCKILVSKIPEFKDNINLYINTLESSINEINKNSNKLENFNIK